MRGQETYRSQFHIEGRVIASITLALLAHSPRTYPDACWALAAPPFRQAADLARFCSCIFRKLDLFSSTVPMLTAIIESCFEFILENTVRMLVNACALVVAKIVNDEQLCIIDAAELLKVDVAQLGAAEHVVISVLLQTSHPSGLLIAPTAYARPLLISYEAYDSACSFVMRELAATHIAGSWHRTLAVRMRLARRAERSAARSATNNLAAKLEAVAKLDTAIQRAYRKAALANTTPSPVCITSQPDLAMETPFVLDSKVTRRNQSMMTASPSLLAPRPSPL
jgi:hypothetical protein